MMFESGEGSEPGAPGANQHLLYLSRFLSSWHDTSSSRTVDIYWDFCRIEITGFVNNQKARSFMLPCPDPRTVMLPVKR